MLICSEMFRSPPPPLDFTLIVKMYILSKMNQISDLWTVVKMYSILFQDVCGDWKLEKNQIIQVLFHFNFSILVSLVEIEFATVNFKIFGLLRRLKSYICFYYSTNTDEKYLDLWWLFYQWAHLLCVFYSQFKFCSV